MRLIQKNERGRQGRKRALQYLEGWKNKLKKEQQRQEAYQTGKDYNEEDEKRNAIVVIQKVFKAYKARKRVESIREDELIFLGMAPNPRNKEIHERADQTRELRKHQIKQNA